MTFYYAYLYTIVMAVGPILILIGIYLSFNDLIHFAKDLIVLNSAIVLVIRVKDKRNKYAAINKIEDLSTTVASADTSSSELTTLVIVVCLFISCNILVKQVS